MSSAWGQSFGDAWGSSWGQTAQVGALGSRKGRGSRRERLVVEIDGEFHRVMSQADAERLSELMPKAKPPPPELSIMVHPGQGKRAMPKFKRFKPKTSLLGKKRNSLL